MAAVPTFVINLAWDQARFRHMQSQLQAIGMAAEFVPAVDGQRLTESDRSQYDRKRTLRVYGTEMTNGEIGCYLSHFRLYQRIVRDAIPMALILEDDLEIGPTLPDIIQGLASDPEPPWLVVRLDTLRGAVINPQKAKDKGRLIQRLNGADLFKLDVHVLGFGAYLIRQQAAVRMLTYGQKIFMSIDQTMDRFWENGIEPYVVRPFPVRQRGDFESRLGRPQRRPAGQSLGLYVARRAQRILDSVRKRLYVLARGT